ncbi:sensor histidine kinase [Phenylobacterium sp.]|uniref:sensor histidine kinase n=1 Tax=Phenylobacterium sp. TaxID=1871053 RepID=UPI002E33AEE9|nr:ATP-binding protein [Phenylobacterium sp.]HEX3367898.1 ATP-binding protein [Phenylobacterium sp.]
MTRRVDISPTWIGSLSTPGRYALAVVLVAISTAGALVLERVTGSNRVAGAYLVGVLVTAYLVGSGPGYLAAAASFVIYNFYLARSHISLAAYTPEDFLVLLTFPTVALLMGNLTGRVREEAKRAQTRALTTAVLFEGTREFSASDDPGLIRARLADHLAAAARGQAFVMDRDVLCAAGGAEPEPMVLSAARALAAEAGEPRTIEAAGWRVRRLASGALAGWRADPPPAADEENLLQILADAGATAMARASLTVAKADAEARSRTEDLRNALLSSISHDLRTPLAAVLASASSLQEFGDQFDAKTRHDLTATIQEEAERLNAFVTNLLNMTRLEGGALEPASAVFDLAEVVDRTRKRFERLRGQRKISCKLGEGADVAMGDPVLFEVALANVLENAVRYSPDGGTIALTSFPHGGQVVVQVTDEGPGVPEGELGKLFDKFYRGAAAKRLPGTGLGLSIVRGVMQGMGGQASAALRTDGPSGMVMSLTLPAVRV